MKTENPANVGKHAFEVAGLGKAPFRFIGASDKVITYPDGTSKAGSCCDYCFTGIRTECWVQSADGKQFKVGCNCIEKVGDKGLLKAYKSSPEYRAHQRQLAQARAKIVSDKLNSLIDSHKARLAQIPHPAGFTDRETGKPLTALDWATWMRDHCGASGKAQILHRLDRWSLHQGEIL